MKKLLGIILLLASFGASSQLVQGTALKITGLTGIMQGNGTTNASAISNSSTVGQVFRVTGASTYGWGALDLSDGDAITGSLPTASIAGITTVGTNLLTVPNPSAIRFFNIAADNSITLSTAADFRTAIGAGTGNGTVTGTGTANYVTYWSGTSAITGSSLFQHDGSGNIDITGSLDVDNINLNTAAITLSTSDGSDNLRATLTGGGNAGDNSRGAWVGANGNEVGGASNGLLQLSAGNVNSTGQIWFYTAGSPQAKLQYDGDWDFEGNAITDAIGSGITGLPISTGVSGLGTGVATVLAVNTGTAGSFVVNGGALGTPSSGTGTNITGIPAANILAGTFGAGAYTLDGTLSITNTAGNGITIFGTARATFPGSTTPSIQMEGNAADRSRISLINSQTGAANPAVFYLGKVRGGIGGTTTVNNGDQIGIHSFVGYDGTSFVEGATIRADASGAVSTGVVPMSLVFRTMTTGGTLTTAWTINSSQNLVPTGSVTLGLTGTRVSNIYTTNQTTTNAETVDSDITLKTNIHSIVNATEKIKLLEPVEYTWKADSLNKIHYGLIAQDVEKVLKEVVVKREESGTLGVAYTELIPYLIQTIKELEARVQELENK